METKKLLLEIKNYHNFSKKRISAITGINPRRLEELIAGYNPKKEEKHQIETLKRFACICGRGLNFDGEIAFEKNELSRLDKELHNKLVALDPETEEQVIEYVDCIKAESMYLGSFYSNNNQEDVIYNAVRRVRKVKGS